MILPQRFRSHDTNYHSWWILVTVKIKDSYFKTIPIDDSVLFVKHSNLVTQLCNIPIPSSSVAIEMDEGK